MKDDGAENAEYKKIIDMNILKNKSAQYTNIIYFINLYFSHGHFIYGIFLLH